MLRNRCCQTSIEDARPGKGYTGNKQVDSLFVIRVFVIRVFVIRYSFPKSRVTNPESRITSHESRVPNHESRVPNPESRIHESPPAHQVTVKRTGKLSCRIPSP